MMLSPRILHLRIYWFKDRLLPVTSYLLTSINSKEDLGSSFIDPSNSNINVHIDIIIKFDHVQFGQHQTPVQTISIFTTIFRSWL